MCESLEHGLALAHLSRNSFGNLTPRKKPRFRKFPGKSDLRRRVGWVQYAPTRRSRSVSYVSPFGTQRWPMRRRSARQPSWPPPAASLSVGGTTPDIFVARLHDLGTEWHELKRVVPRSASPPTQVRLIVMIEGGAVPCLSPVVTDFPEISRKFEGLRLELVSRNFALVQQKSGPRPSLRHPSRGTRRVLREAGCNLAR